MGVEDLPKLGKVVKLGKLGKAVKTADDAEDLVRVIEYMDEVVEFPYPITRTQAKQYIWNKIIKPKMQGGEQKIDMPSELPPERLEEINKLENPPSAEVIPIRDNRTEAEKLAKEVLDRPGERERVKDISNELLDELRTEPSPWQKLEPGIYLDEDSGKYMKIDKDGNMVELE